MIYGIGHDLLKVSNIEQAVSDPSDPFVRNIYTDRELALIQSRPIPLYSYATRFSGKEAVFKCLNLHGDAIRLNEIEILENENGQPFVILHGRAKTAAIEKGIVQVHISLSYDTDYASSTAIAEIP